MQIRTLTILAVMAATLSTGASPLAAGSAQARQKKVAEKAFERGAQKVAEMDAVRAQDYEVLIAKAAAPVALKHLVFTPLDEKWHTAVTRDDPVVMDTGIPSFAKAVDLGPQDGTKLIEVAAAKKPNGMMLPGSGYTDYFMPAVLILNEQKELVRIAAPEGFNDPREMAELCTPFAVSTHLAPGERYAVVITNPTLSHTRQYYEVYVGGVYMDGYHHIPIHCLGPIEIKVKDIPSPGNLPRGRRK